MPDFSPLKLHDTLEGVRSRADGVDQTGDWPAQDLRALADFGVMRWAVPKEFGGDEIPPFDLHRRYEAIAAASMTSALILTQRDSAISMISAAVSWPGRGQALKGLANHELFTTVGIAQLTTSRQRGAPAVRATRVEGGYLLNGEIPWATGAGHAQFIIAGAVLEDRRQILFALPMKLAGVRVSPPLPLVALCASHTASVFCQDARLEDHQILIGPVEHALSLRSKGIPIGQAFLATGLCSGALRLIGEFHSDAARSAFDRLMPQLARLSTQITDHCSASAPDEARGNALRGQSIDLALRTTHAVVSLYKGTGLLAGHPAQRLAREALFLLVWSCPGPVVECTLDLLTRMEG